MTDIDRFVSESVRAARRLVIGVLGFTVLAVGFSLLFLPGPAFVVIPIGLAILGIEFGWARRLLMRARKLTRNKTESDDSLSEERRKG